MADDALVTFADRLMRGPARLLHGRVKRMRRRGRPGAHAIALTAERRLILVRLRYAPGWRLPGGGIRRRELPQDAALRELREEIGMHSHGAVRTVGDSGDLAQLIIVEEVLYARPKWSWEVEAILEASLESLPMDLSPLTARWLEAAIEWL